MDDLKHQPTGGRTEVEVVAQADEGDPNCCEFGQRIDQVLQGPPKAVAV
jgi:hypothetical protein